MYLPKNKRFYFGLLNKRAQSVVSDETIKWIIYIAILVAAGFVIKQIVSRAAG
ncbi:MAG: hypothetical protein OEL87_03685 [Nanoarchaeota archaeon]|nr:hypothetical protein [Nanoarchaeota archaeon]